MFELSTNVSQPYNNITTYLHTALEIQLNLIRGCMPCKHESESGSFVENFLTIVYGYLILSHQTGWSIGNALGLYAGGAQFKSQPGHWLPWWFCGFAQSFRANAKVVSRLGHDDFFPGPFQIIIDFLSYCLTLYRLGTKKVSLNNSWRKESYHIIC
jgi:hypothetical protein